MKPCWISTIVDIHVSLLTAFTIFAKTELYISRYSYQFIDDKFACWSASTLQ